MGLGNTHSSAIATAGACQDMLVPFAFTPQAWQNVTGLLTIDTGIGKKG
jgi:hypothetical protein